MGKGLSAVKESVMVRITIVSGMLLIALGLGDYYAMTEKSWLPFIAMALGLGMLVSGLIALKDSLRKNAMHAAVLLGLIGTAYALIQIGRLVLEKPELIAQSGMALLCGAFIVLAIKSFLDARRSRPSPPDQPPAERREDEQVQ